MDRWTDGDGDGERVNDVRFMEMSDERGFTCGLVWSWVLGLRLGVLGRNRMGWVRGVRLT